MATKYVIADLAEKTDTEVRELKKIFTEVVSFIESMKVGDKLSINDLGIFKKVKKAARNARNPKTGETIKVPAKVTIKFRVASNLRDL